jgi:hypothetical protein
MSESQPERVVRLRTPQMQMAARTLVLRCSLAVLLSIICLPPQRALAQALGQGEQSARAESGDGGHVAQASTSDKSNAEIFHELEQMRARIQELESKLRQQSGPEATTPQSNQQAATTSQGFLSTPAVQAGGDQSAQSRPAKAEPFAFADFTWLNGNPRTKTPFRNQVLHARNQGGRRLCL